MQFDPRSHTQGGSGPYLDDTFMMEGKLQNISTHTQRDLLLCHRYIIHFRSIGRGGGVGESEC